MMNRKTNRIIALLLAVCTLSSLLLLSGCAKGGKSTDLPAASESASPNSAADSSPSKPTESTSSSAEEPIELPASTTLYGTKHLPIPDNQGSIGSCTSEGVTYTQFTVAVSQLINATDPDSDWDPSSGNPKYIFSPKYTYNFAGPSTEYCYSVLRDHGALTMNLSCFYKYERNPNQPYQNPSVLNQDASRSWDVSKELMEKALKYRITDFEEIDFTATCSGQLTTDEQSLKVFYKVKQALARGNAVAVCGWPLYFNHTKLTEEGKGSIGIAGESVVWSGSGNADGSGSSGNHCITIIGYDDEITVTVGGVTMKGAFQIRDSYANDNRDIYYVMYDAFNKVSSHEEFRDPNFYLNTVALSLSGNEFEYGYQAEHNQMLTLTPTAKTLEKNGKSYPVYTVSDGQTGAFLTFKGGSFTAGKENDAASFALIPYEDVKTAASDEAFKGSYLMALLSGQDTVEGYLGAEVNTNHASIRFYKEAEGNMDKICYELSAKNTEGTFNTRISLAKENKGGYVRTGTMYRFSFLYWDEDVQIGTPTLMVEAKISKIGRDNLGFVLTRTDKNGSTKEYTPACTDIPLNKSFFPELMQDGDTAFSGKTQPTQAEIGYFTFGFHILDDFGEAAKYEEFIWGVKIRGVGTEVLKIRLLDQQGNELCAVTPAENDRTVEKGSPKHFEFRQNEELSAHFGSGAYTFYNVGQQKTLSLKTNNMLFEWQNPKKTDSVERSVFRAEYDAQTGTYLFRHGTMDYVFDIHGSELKEGATVKMNARSQQRKGQLWSVIRNDDGTVCIASQEAPSLYLGYDGKNFTLGSDPENKNYRFIAMAASDAGRCLDLTLTEKGFEARAVLPEDCKAEELSLLIVKDGKVEKTLNGALKDGALQFEAELSSGDYLVCLAKNGVCFSNRIAFRAE